MQMLILALALFLALAPCAAGAQSLPSWQYPFVNDYAGILAPETSAQVRSSLQRLKSETGVEVTLLTIPSRAAFGASGPIEPFATALFNSWGIGRAKYNDGILVLIDPADRDMRIELGRGYGQDYSTLAQDIVDRWFLPEFRKGDYNAGILAGMPQVVSRLAERHAQALPPEKLPFSPAAFAKRNLPWLAFGGMALLILLSKLAPRLGDMAYRYRTCPQCGTQGLMRNRVGPASSTFPPYGMINTWCPHCSYRLSEPWRNGGPTNRFRGGGGGGFGGGSSSGGGASGRW